MDKFINKPTNEVCDISLIYSDNPSKTMNEPIKNKQITLSKAITSSFIQNNAQTRDTNTLQNNSINGQKLISQFNQDSSKETTSKIKCSKCTNYINKGEIVYHCKCDTFIHSSCYLKNINDQNIKQCPRCNSNLTIGIYELNLPNNTLSTGLRYKNKYLMSNQGHSNTNNTSNKSSFSVKDKTGSINSNILTSTNEIDSTNDKSKICMDTNINGLEDYDKLCDTAADIPLESMIEILNEKENNDNITKMEEVNNNKGLNIRSTLINMNKNSVVDKTVINRVALSPIPLMSTPYTCNKKNGSSCFNSIRNNNAKDKFTNNSSFLNSNNSNNNINNVKRKLTFLSENKDISINLNGIDNNNLNNTLLNLNNSNYSSSQYSNNTLRNLDFNDITNEDISEEDNDEDKENNPPLLKENSRFIPNEENNNDENKNENDSSNKNNIEIKISGGISHITSDQKKTVEIPLTIELNIINSNVVDYTKDTLLIFNTNSLNLEQILLILKIFNEKMGKNDKIYSNIFKSVSGLNKDQINYILNINDNNYHEVFQETERINYDKISTLIEYAIDLSMNSLSNIFSVLLINDIDMIDSLNGDYSSEIKKVIKKLETTKVNLLKYFSITTILLDDQGTDLSPKTKNEKNINFISYLYDLSMMCMGYFYSPKNLDELIKSVYLFCCNLEQYSLLNAKLIIKGNQDPSVYLEALNYPINKINHNDFEIVLGSLLKKEKKIINLVATVILNNPDINLLLPIMDVSCEYLSKKNEIIIDNNNMKSLNDNTFKERTDFYRVNLPIIPQKKKLKISYSVILRNIISKTAQRISRAIDFFKKGDYNNALKHINEARNTYENNIKNQNDFLKKIQNVINDNNNANINANYNMNINNINFSFLDNSSFDINNNLNGSNMMDTKNDSLLKIANFINAISNDLNLCVNIIKMRDLNKICQMFSIQQSLSFYRVVIFDDNRFLEDNYLNMN